VIAANTSDGSSEVRTICTNLHEGQTTPASLEDEQEAIPALQLRRKDSFPVHSTLLRRTGPFPCPKAA